MDGIEIRQVKVKMQFEKDLLLKVNNAIEFFVGVMLSVNQWHFLSGDVLERKNYSKHNDNIQSLYLETEKAYTKFYLTGVFGDVCCNICHKCRGGAGMLHVRYKRSERTLVGLFREAYNKLHKYINFERQAYKTFLCLEECKRAVQESDEEFDLLIAILF